MRASDFQLDSDNPRRNSVYEARWLLGAVFVLAVIVLTMVAVTS